MKKALRLAARALGRTSPNPAVGAVLVKNGLALAEGWHEKAGQAHAEIVALRQAGAAARGATMYVTLEPCSHYGRTGPCADALIAAGVKRVVAAVRDPNPLVSGRGLARLRAAGVEVAEGVLADEAARLNEVFFKWITTGLPFVAAKYAMSLDGKIAARTGDARWISGEKSRQEAHRLRGRYDAIMVGIGTVLADDPALTCRLPGGRNPLRIVVDSLARIPPAAQVLRDGQAPTLIAATDKAPPERLAALRRLPGVTVMVLPDRAGRVDLPELLRQLGRDKITGVLVEGGGGLHGSLLAERLADKLYAFIAPKIIGGADAPGPVGGAGAALVAEAWRLRGFKVRKSGEDLLIAGYFT
jgi:diaminohydroxyphosphoribosylaminopyrimidine deaminase/5-amino-6-(5-phosphoribosylamino)uracil reductase